MKAMKRSEFLDVPLTLAFILRGHTYSIQAFLDDLETLLKDHPDVRIVHREASPGRLWIKREGEP